MLVHCRQKAGFLALELTDLLEQIADGVVARQLRLQRRAFLLQSFDLGSKSLVFRDELLGERRAAFEERLSEGVALLLEIAAAVFDGLEGFGRLVTFRRASLFPGHGPRPYHFFGVGWPS
jgi:hypothetical protein